MSRLSIGLLVVMAVSVGPLTAQTGTAPLSAIRNELERIRADIPKYPDTRGASPALTTVKHQLRDWVESQLSQVPSDPNGEDGAERALETRINDELKRERLFREGDDEDGWNWGGFLGHVQISYRQRQSYLVVQTAIEVNCGFDQSAYIYRWEDNRWNRIWETEQNSYSKKDYKVQHIREVLVSPPFNGSTPYVMTLGTEPWCSSNWHDVYVRIWNVGAGGPKLLLDKSEVAFLGGHDIPVQGSIGRKDALVEYTVGSIDTDVFSREVVLHYALAPDKAQRIGPVALSPRDFVDEWLSQPWEQSRLWSQPSSRASLLKAHKKTSRDQFQPTRHCQTSDLWQVGLESTDGSLSPIYFLVRWQPPYRFTMIQASPKPMAGCVQDDPEADEPRTLFPVQDWRE